MVILITLIVLFAIFFVIRKHVGPAHLAVVAGVSVYQTFGEQLVDMLGKVIEGASLDLVGHCVYLALVLVFPLLLYFHSSHGGLFGILRIIESAAFAALLTSLISGPLAYFFPFDTLATQIFDWIKTFEGPIVVFGLVTAYIDVIFYHE